ncbi:MAG: FGGY-family carbohydrate kinase [Paracoccaceae bacterium]|nr:FGGY-family carbohydrate kinase [Paracoccaceae bacterium]
MTPRHIAVIDIGKTNVKLALVEGVTLTELEVVTRPNKVLPGPPWPHFDTEGTWAFLTDALARFHVHHGVEAISITTHGACAALLTADGSLAAPVLDYEHDGPQQTAREYDALRPAFEVTGSPRLPHGLNLGAQLHWQLATTPGLLDRVAQVVTWPQYWAFRLTGRMATDVTSLGCHTDLWCPGARDFSSLVERLGLVGKMAPPRRPDEILGTLLPDISAATGLPEATPVAVGIHDSNASLLPHLKARAAPFSVVSTGTWVVVMTVGGRAVTLDPARDTLINVNAFGAAIPSARFMGGREYEVIRAGSEVAPSPEDVTEVLDAGILLLPAVEPSSGPFAGRAMEWRNLPADARPGLRMAALSFYLALMTAECLSMTGSGGPIIVEGPFGGNVNYLQMLAAATGQPVLASRARTGTSAGAALLVTDLRASSTVFDPTYIDAELRANMAAYASRMRLSFLNRDHARA